MKGLLAVAIVAAFVLAGCTGKSDTSSSTSKSGSATGTGTTSKTATGTATSGPTTTASSTSTQTQTGTQGPQEKTHSATLAASVRNGTAPLNVTFTLTATNTDAQTTWSIAFGDGGVQNGTTLPGTATHQYTASGTKIVNATVKFGDGKTATSSISIAVLPSSATGGALVNKTYSGTIPIPKPAGTGTVCANTGAEPSCTANQIQALNENGGNETFFLWYDFTVPAGTASLLVEAGSQETQTCEPAAGNCVPDFDFYLYPPTGTATAVGTEAAWESAAIEAPAAGTWSVAVVYYAGPPNGHATTHIVVR